MNRILIDIVRTAVFLGMAWLCITGSVPVARFMGDPDYAAIMFKFGMVLHAVAILPLMKRTLFPYIDLKAIAKTAIDEDNYGAGLVFLGMCVVLAAFVSLFSGKAGATELPANAVKYLPILKLEQRAWWPDMPVPSVLGSLIEQESCITLKSKRCWSPDAELKTDREQGIGLGQITRTARFDALADLRRANPEALRDWGWDKPTLRDPHYQLRGVILLERQNWRGIGGAATPEDRAAFMDAAYNGGAGGLSSDRKICAATPGCDRGRWFGHVENTSLKKKTAVAGYGQSFFDINRTHVRNVLLVRRPRYVAALER